MANDIGSLWIMWTDDITCNVLSTESQQISLSCTYMGYQFILTCICASYNAEVRKQLWNSLLQPSYDKPWMATGDYNVVRT